MPTNEQRRENAKRKLERQLERRAEKAKKRRMMAIIGGATAVVVLIAAVVATVLLTRDDSGDSTAATSAEDPFATTGVPEPAADGQLPAFTPTADTGADCQYPASREPSKPNEPPRTGRVPTDPAQVSVSMETNQGNVGLMLDNAKSPCTVNSFVSLAQQGYFDDTVCHRLTTTPGLSVLQCGDPTGSGSGGPGYQFPNEYPTNQYPAGSPAAQSPVVYPRGTLAMANAGPGTNGSQFFLVYADSQLPPQYTVFGTIDETGLGTLDRVANAGVEGGAADGAPANEVRITSVALD
ncbi:peptidylprolyl isomerase [[Mycobacterium] wendilense]|uniref:Peptidyl-prolyl cis-trans isomerase n=1 Tax=[Mycobacterium] wendilense TaxID=3064284 RepID=A0ABN9NZN0_9MYCO|nr:peptidylprolyl isomerase [Mycolicibacterium sp. MU0050]CAJ1583573.1 peptidylprolyl isomerase [Mycolicibacterium sp. MU0050]